MQNADIFIEKVDGTKRQIEWAELNQLKKDILWMFDENGSELHNAFVPDYSFTLPYWEYVTLNGGKFFSEEEKQFYKEGSLIIILCMVAEYVDIIGGSQLVFGNNKIDYILDYIKLFEPVNQKQSTLKDLLILGLSIAASITKEDLSRNEDFEHSHMDHFYSKLPWVSITFIQAYYKAKLDMK
jgi:hypothetical protein